MRGSIRSLLDQSYPHIEIIVVDDESPDGSMGIVNSIRWRNPVVRVIRQKNGGLGSARNTGARHARGEYLMFFDSDDKVTPWAFTSAIDALNSSGSDFSVAPYNRLSGTKVRPAGHWIYDAHSEERLGVSLPDHPEILVNMTAWSKIYRRSFWETHEFEFPQGVLYEDQALSTRAYAAAEKFDILSRVGVLWRIRGDRSSISQQYTSARNVRDHHLAARESLVALSGPKLADARDTRITQLLANDYAHPLAGLADFDDEAWEAFVAALRYLYHEASRVDWLQIAARNRIMYDLIIANRRKEAVEFLTLRGRFEDTWPSIVVDGQVFADLPFRNRPELPIRPQSFIRSHHDTRLRSAIVSARWADADTLHLKLWAGITNVPSSHNDTNFTAHLVSTRLPIRIQLESQPASADDDEVAQYSTPNVDASGQFVEVAVPLSQLPMVATSYGLLLTLRTQGVERTRMLHFGSPNAPVRFAQRSEFATWDLHADRASFATISHVDWRAHLDEAIITPHTAVVKVSTDLPEVALVVNGGPVEGTIVSQASLDKTTRTARLTFGSPRSVPVRHSQTWRLVALDADGNRSSVLGAAHASTADDAAFLSAGAIVVHRLGARVFSSADSRGAGAKIELPAAAVMIRENGITVRADKMTVSGGKITVTFTGLHVPATAFAKRGSQEIPAEILPSETGFALRFAELTERWSVVGTRPWRLGRYRLTIADANGRDIFVERPTRQISPNAWTASSRCARYVLHAQGRSLALEVCSPARAHDRGAFHHNQNRRTYLAANRALRPSVLFRNLYGDAANDTAKAVHTRLVESGTEMNLIWAVKSPEVAIPAGATPVLEGSREYWDAFADSKYIMVNVHQPDWFQKKPGQVLVQTFHGYPFKLAGRRHWAKTGLTQARVDSFYKRALEWDYLLSPAPYATPLLAEFLPEHTPWSGEFLEIGYPRNDVLVSPPEGHRERIRSSLGIRPEQTAVLYAPTYRDYLSVSEFAATALELLDADRISAALGDQFVVLTRGHVMNSRASSAVAHGSAALDVTEYPDVNDLILASDAAILDYSSLRFDYALTGKPMIFLNPDREEYLAARDPMVPYEATAPGPWVGSSDEIIEGLRHLDAVRSEYAEARTEFLQRYMPLEDGHATERIVEAVFRTRGDG